MGMDIGTGKIRSLLIKEELKETEVLFEIGEVVELKGCNFDVIAVYPDPANEITLKGKAQNPFEKFGIEQTSLEEKFHELQCEQQSETEATL